MTDVAASHARIEAHKQQAKMRSVLRCVADAKGTVSDQQMMLAAQLTGVELPRDLATRNSPRRHEVQPLLDSIAPTMAPRSSSPRR